MGPSRDVSLEMDAAQFKTALEHTWKLLQPYVNTDAPLVGGELKGNELLERLRHDTLNEAPIPLSEVLNESLFQGLAVGINSNSPNYMADIPGGGLLYSALADFVTSVINRWPGLHEWAPMLIEMEAKALQWMSQDILGLPQGAGGVFTSGGSLATFFALCAARIDRLGSNFAQGTMYVSSESHHSVEKAARLAGLDPAMVKSVEIDEQGRMIPDRLARQIAADAEAKRRPFLIVATAGSTRTGIVDPLPEIAGIAGRTNCWFHVDAAWAGGFRITDRGRRQLAGIESAESVTLDPHKTFWLPWGNGAVLVRNPATLHRAFSCDADYMPFGDGDDLMRNPANISGELSRNARGMQLWLPLKVCGLGAFRRAMDERFDLADWLARELEGMDLIKLCAGPSLGVVCFCLHHPEASPEQLDHATGRLVEAVQKQGKHYIATVVIRGRVAARVAPLHFKTHKEHVKALVESIAAHGREIAAELGWTARP